MNKVICNFLYYRRHGVCCYMCWQRPGIGKAPSFTLVRIKQQFRAVVLRFLIFFLFCVSSNPRISWMYRDCSSAQGCNVEIKHEMAAGSIPGVTAGAGAGTGLEQIKQQHPSPPASGERVYTQPISHLTCFLLLEQPWRLFQMIVLRVIKSPARLILQPYKNQ